MGILIRQSFWITLIGYLGVILGYINTLILRPEFLTEGEIGLLNLVISNSMLIAPLVCLGMPGAYLRLINFVRDNEEERKQLFTFQFCIILTVNAIVIILAWIFLPHIQSIFSEKSEAYNQYIFVSVFVILFYSLFLQLSAYSRAMLNTIFPEFINNVFLRLGNGILLLAFGFRLIDFDFLVKSLIILYSGAFLLNLLYLIKSYNFKFAFRFSSLTGKVKKEIFSFGANLVLISLGGTIANQIFFLLVSVYIGLEANGIFSICFYIATVIEMPRRSMVQVIVPIFSREFKQMNIPEIGNLYQKSSLTLSVFSMLLLLGVICNLEDLFLIIPNGLIYREGFFVVILVGAAKVIDLTFGFNSELISYSKHYKYLLLFSTLHGLLTLTTCFLLIPEFGINGAAWSFLLSMVIFNLIKFTFIKIRFRISPFTKGHLAIVLISLTIYLLSSYVPLGLAPIPNILVKSVLITMTYSILVYALRISSDINNLARKIINRLFNF